MSRPVRNLFLDVAGLRTHFLASGDSGPALLLLHGTAIDSASLTYGGIVQALGERFRVYAMDWPGYGQSRPHVQGHEFAFLRGFLSAAIDALQLGRPTVAGFSMGGAAALGLALEEPDRVERLVLIDSYGLGGTLHLPVLPYVALRMRVANEQVWAALRRSKRILRWFLANIVLGDPRLATPHLVEEVHEQLRTPGSEEAFMKWLQQEIRPGRLRTSYRRRLPELRTPTLFLHGSRDLIVPAYRARRSARLVKGSRLVLAPGCGHWLPRERPHLLQRELSRFMSVTRS